MNIIDKYIWSENYLRGQGYSEYDINKYFNIDKECINEVKKQIFIKCSTKKKMEKKLIYYYSWKCFI